MWSGRQSIAWEENGDSKYSSAECQCQRKRVQASVRNGIHPKVKRRRRRRRKGEEILESKREEKEEKVGLEEGQKRKSRREEGPEDE